MIDKENTLDSVIFDGIRFLESLTAHYGSDKGMEMWEAMGEAMGREVKGKVFFAMLTGSTTGRIQFTSGTAETSNAVPVIKCIRTYTGFGLKEAKDKWDLSKVQAVQLDVAPDQQRAFADKLRELGCRVS